MSLRVMHVFITWLGPHNIRHLNALNLPQFLSHLSLKTSHTPTFKPPACGRSSAQAAVSIQCWLLVEVTVKTVEPLRLSKSWHNRDGFGSVSES